jgi:hypothetical protein
MVVLMELVVGSYGFRFWFLSEKKMSKRAPDCFVEISAQGIIAEELNGQAGRADEGPQIPRELRPEKKIAAEPTK